jgi:hypothetical protein
VKQSSFYPPFIEKPGTFLVIVPSDLNFAVKLFGRQSKIIAYGGRARCLGKVSQEAAVTA